MKTKLVVFFLCLCGHLQADDVLPSYIRLLPWDTSSVVPAGQDEKADITVTIAYDRPGIISDVDTYRLRLKPKEKHVFYGLPRTHKARDSFGPTGKWCSGGSHVSKVTKDALEISITLSWGDRSGKTGSFKETLTLPWKERETIERDGFKIDVTIEPQRPVSSKSSP